MRLAVTVAWRTANYSRAKKMPSLKSELRKLQRKPRRGKRQSAEEQITIMRIFSAGMNAANAKREKRKRR